MGEVAITGNNKAVGVLNEANREIKSNGDGFLTIHTRQFSAGNKKDYRRGVYSLRYREDEPVILDVLTLSKETAKRFWFDKTEDISRGQTYVYLPNDSPIKVREDDKLKLLNSDIYLRRKDGRVRDGYVSV